MLVESITGADDDYNVVHKDGSFEFGHENPDSYHHAQANRNNVVRGEFGSRNPGTGAIDSTIYTAGPRGFRPRGKNVVRKYDLSQAGPRPIGSPDDPYYDPYEDPSYNFGFRTRTYNRQESANRVGDVTGKYSFLDDIGERHNIEYIAGKNTGFHVKTPFPDSNPRAYGPLYFRGRGRPIPRGRTSIQRGLDGSYKFVSAGPDQRRTETSDSTGHVRGSYTYLDDKGVQHSVHYIAGPETGYRVLKNVKGPHLPTVFPFGRPEIIPPDFYDDLGKDTGDVFDTAASGHIKPGKPSKPGRPNKEQSPTFSGGVDIDKDDFDKSDDTSNDDDIFGTSPTGKPNGGGYPSGKPSGVGLKPSRPSSSSAAIGGFEDDVKPSGIGGANGVSGGGRPSDKDFDSSSGGNYKPSGSDDGSYKPSGDNDGSYKPTDDGKYKPGLYDYPYDYDYYGDYKPTIGIGGGAGGGGASGGSGSSNNKNCPKCKGTIVTNLGDRYFSVPPGVSVRAHVQSIDLLPLIGSVKSPSEQYKSDVAPKTEQLNSEANDLIENREDKEEEVATTTTTSSTTTPSPEITKAKPDN